MRTRSALSGKVASATLRAWPAPSTVSRRGALKVAERRPASTAAWAGCILAGTPPTMPSCSSSRSSAASAAAGAEGFRRAFAIGAGAGA